MSVYLPSGQFDCKVSPLKGGPLGLHGQKSDIPDAHRCAGTLPDSWSRLAKLQNLHLANNSITGVTM